MAQHGRRQHRRRMSVRSTLAAVAMAAATSMHGHGIARAHPPAIVSGPAERAMAEEVADFRKRLAAAIRARDAAALDGMYVVSFRHTTDAGGLDDKAAHIAAAMSGRPMIETAAVEELRISVPNGWAAIATGLSTLPSSVDGAVSRLRWTTVYVRIGDGWQVAASQATRLADR